MVCFKASMLASAARHFPADTRVTRPAGGYFLWFEFAPQVDSLQLFKQATHRRNHGERLIQLDVVPRIGNFDVDLAREFFQGFVNHAGVTVHIDNLRGDNAHHQCETVFKAFARALRMAAERDERAAGTIPSTKGAL
mgnify:CR=1 FL=1